jgi:hypothetical protein
VTAGDPRPEFDRDAAERVLRRAVRLSEQADQGDDPHGISEQALIEAADELGVEVEVVRRAAVEERLGLLVTTRRRGDQLVGVGRIRVHRDVPGEPGELLARLDAWLRRIGSFRRQRGDARTAQYARRGDPTSWVQRSTRTLRGQEDLRRVQRLHVTATPLGAGRCLVVVDADLELERSLTLAAGTGVAGVGSSVAVVEALVWTPWLWLGVPASIAAGTGLLVARAHGVPDVEASLEGLLDRVEAGGLPSSVLGEVTDRVVRSVTSRVRRTT